MSSISSSPALEGLGWSPHFQQQLSALLAENPTLAANAVLRVALDLGVEYGLLGTDGMRRAVLPGRIARGISDEVRPCVGDFVLAAPPVGGELWRIEHVFARASAFRRKVAGEESRGQAIAANVDVAIVVNAFAGADADKHAEQRGLNLRRIERYLVAIRDAPAHAIVVVNKADLDPNAEARALEVAREIGFPEVIAVSTRTGLGLDRLFAEVGPGRTAVLVGSSGVGKSSLVNAWVGRDVQRVEAVREADARGRHTTTHRELVALSSGGFLIDTPGMREFGLFSDEATDDPRSTGFADVDALAEQCRFRDCTHESEPGCAVLRAVERGELDASRLEHARKLTREMRRQRGLHDELQRRVIRRQHRNLSRAGRARQREKGNVDD